MVDLIKKNAKSLQESLFSSVGSAALTIATSYLVINFFRGMLGFALTSDKDWLAVLNNMQLYMVQADPEEDFIRVWLSVGAIIVKKSTPSPPLKKELNTLELFTLSSLLQMPIDNPARTKVSPTDNQTLIKSSSGYA